MSTRSARFINTSFHIKFVKRRKCLWKFLVPTISEEKALRALVDKSGKTAVQMILKNLGNMYPVSYTHLTLPTKA